MDRQNVNRFIFLYGPPGAGKSSVGRRLAKVLEVPFCDLDGEIELFSRMSIEEIFSRDGEGVFRRLEKAALERIVESGDGVVALGGGALLDESSRSLVEKRGKGLLFGFPI